MKSIIILLKHLVLLVSFSLFFVFPRLSSSQMVVSKGWENLDSIRFEAYDSFFPDQGWPTTNGAPPKESPTRVQRLMDSLGINVVFTYSAIAANQAPFGGRRKGYDAYPLDFTSGSIGLQDIGEKLKQRIYYPSPEKIDLAK